MQFQPQAADLSGVQAMEWCGSSLRLLDQRRLPEEGNWVECQDAVQVAEAIRTGVVQGAAAVGIAAAYGIALAARRIGQAQDWTAALEADFALLSAARPSAANLRWALRMLRERLRRPLGVAANIPELLAQAAISIHVSDREANLAMGKLGMQVIRRHDRQPQNMLTFGNAGALAGGGYGSALGVIRAAHAAGLVAELHACETRPGRAGQRTLWELTQDELPVKLHVDAAAGHLMKSENLSWVVVGAEYIAANGDVVSAIGTYALAILAMHHGLRFMVVAPSSSVDLSLETADEVDLGQPSPGQGGQQLFDVTPADLIDVIVTEKGIVERPDQPRLAELLSHRRLH
ncbi:methylthioribose-1-phosphate isomerase [Halopseudomonas litoralis]|uniref:Methylthioribose-1-phosphate isomerase n=1 Tax=Halopseudomonas litoralis TaxID=797277 RepID=A0A1H1SV24_9GAMM|nr:S-methyl-5-thioribose-1-phosphate isomerase [Halopseudomonas litoralis]SDS51586.1 methylthioribose-1-phosphate isomerase [Halopseudomonas litoralis]